jgi:hypothetical protein
MMFCVQMVFLKRKNAQISPYIEEKSQKLPYLDNDFVEVARTNQV